MGREVRQGATRHEEEEMSVAVLLHLPNDVYRALVPVAAKHDTQVHNLIEASVTKSVRRKNVTRSRITGAQLSAIRRLNADGLSDAAIARQLGISQASVSRHRGDMGLLPPKPRAGGRQKAVQT